MSCSLTFRLETKMLWCQTHSRKKKAVVFTTVTMSAYLDQLNAGFSKVCKVLFYIKSAHYILHTVLLLWRHFHAPERDVERKTNCDWLFDMTVKLPYIRALANKSCHGFQTFSPQSEGLSMQDY